LEFRGRSGGVLSDTKSVEEGRGEERRGGEGGLRGWWMVVRNVGSQVRRMFQR
jgi:hypothetical protein